MIEQGYYSNRIKELEERKAEVAGLLVTHKLTLKGIVKEITACKEAMNNQTHSINITKHNKDKKILELIKEVEKFKKIKEDYIKKNSELKKENLQLKKALEQSQIAINKLQLRCVPPDDDVILADNFGKENIFEKIIRRDYNE